MKILLLISILISFSVSACVTSKASSDSREELFLDDKSQPESGGDNEIVITEQDLSKSAQQINSEGGAAQAQFYIGEDGSEIKVANDRYGNKTETRCFENHPRLKCVVVTTAANGDKETMLFPVGSGAKQLSGDAAAQALTAAPEELANAAELKFTNDNKINGSVSPYGDGKKSSGQNLKPLPSSEFPIFPKMVQPNPIEQTEEPAVEEKKLDEPETVSKPESQEKIDEE